MVAKQAHPAGQEGSTTMADDKTETSDTLSEAAFRTLAKDALRRVQDAVDAMDPDVVECGVDAEVVKLNFPSGPPFVMNLQPPVREVWLAADRQAWHFRYDGARWVDKRSGDELFDAVKRLVSQRAGVTLAL
jgi:CyaY protein